VASRLQKLRLVHSSTICRLAPQVSERYVELLHQTLPVRLRGRIDATPSSEAQKSRRLDQQIWILHSNVTSRELVSIYPPGPSSRCPANPPSATAPAPETRWYGQCRWTPSMAGVASLHTALGIHHTQTLRCCGQHVCDAGTQVTCVQRLVHAPPLVSVHPVPCMV